MSNSGNKMPVLDTGTALDLVYCIKKTSWKQSDSEERVEGWEKVYQANTRKQKGKVTI